MSDIYAKKQKAPIRSEMRIGTEKLGDMIMSLRIYAISRGMVGIYKNHGDTSIDTTVVHFLSSQSAA